MTILIYIFLVLFWYTHMIQNQTLRYFLYLRKSSESEDRQMASIEDQLKEINKIATELGLTIVGVFSESKSAKAPGRKEFNEMLSQIEKGKADGILCWKLNRLARNPVDGGRISWLLQNNIIKHIQCYGRDYKPSDNVLMMQVEFGMANQFVKDLSVDIKRGVIAKAERGWYPSPNLPLGYIHNKSNARKTHPIEIILDKKRFTIVKKLWKLILTGNYSIADMKRMGDSLGLTGKNGRPYVKSTYHDIFSNEFYCGYFHWKNQKGVKIRYKGKHKLMVSQEEFEEVQYIIGTKKRSTRLHKYDYPYKGIFSCGECGCSITAERKHQVRCTSCRFKFSCINRDNCPKCNTTIKEMTNPTVIDITYYRCTKRKQSCSQKFITKKELELQLEQIVSDITVSEEFYSFINEELELLYKNDINKNEKLQLITTLKKHISELQNRTKGLAIMRADNEINSDEYAAMKKENLDKIESLENELKKLTYAEINWLTVAKSYLDIAINAKETFKKTDYLTKKKLLLNIGSNQQLTDKKLHFIRSKPLSAILNCYDCYKRQKSRFEPKNHLVKQGDYDSLDSQSLEWCTGLDVVRTSIVKTHKLLEYA